MNENELKGITAYVNTGLAWEKAMGLIVTPLQATAPLVTRLVAEYTAQAARIAALEAEVKRLTAVGRVERWEPVADDDYVAADIEIALDGCVIDVDVMDTDGEPVCYRVVLPDDIRLCRKAVTDEATN